MRLGWLIGSLAVIAGCSDEAERIEEPVPMSSCPAGTTELPDGSCLDAGVQLDGCPAGSYATADGCEAAGIPEGACAQGFAWQDHRCLPVLPAAPCDGTQVAFPGETSCHPIGTCGEGTWGDIPLGEVTWFVDQSYAGGDGDGSIDKPFPDVEQALGNAQLGDVVAVAAGLFFSNVLLPPGVTLWGRCPEMVRLEGEVFNGIDPVVNMTFGGTLRGVTLSGATAGILVQGTSTVEEVVLDEVGGTGILVSGAQQDMQLTLRDVLIQDTGYGLTAEGSARVEAERLAVRRTAEAGMQVGGGPDEALVVRQSRFDDNVFAGIVFIGGELDVEGVVVRGTQHAPEAEGSSGIIVGQDVGSSAPIAVRKSVLEDCEGAGITHFGGHAVLEHLTVSGSEAAPDVGFGIAIGGDSNLVATAEILESVADDCASTGLLVYGADAVARRSRFGGRAGSPNYGWGVAVGHKDGLRGTLTIEASMVRDFFQTGLGLNTGTVDATGLAILATPGSGAIDPSTVAMTGDEGPSALRLARSVLTGNERFGIITFSGDVTLEGTVIDGVTADANGFFGDAVAAVAEQDDVRVTAVDARVQQVQRVGLMSFGAQVGLGHSRLDCIDIFLSGLDSFEREARFEDALGNWCGCGTEEALCARRDIEVTPPEAPDAQIQ